MKLHCQNSDRIGSLPEDTIENILSLMPMRDAIRTSILSKNWRYSWTRMPKLVFDDNIVEASSDREMNKYKLANAIFNVLLQHRGPIYELCICTTRTNILDEIDRIIFHPWRSQNIKKFECSPCYKLPCSFFSLEGLEHLDLTFCAFELPLMFNGFSKLKSLRFCDVEITAKMLQRFLTSCPLLEEFTLHFIYRAYFSRRNKCTFAELFSCLPSVQVVNIPWGYVKHVAAGGLSQKLPTSLVHLRILVLDRMFFLNQDDLSSTLCVINSSQNLEKIQMNMVGSAYQSFTTLLDSQDYLGLNLDHLKELEITSFHNYAPEMELVKFIMAKSPVLRKAQIELHTCVSVDEEVTMLRDLLHFSHLHASPAAKFIILRPKNDL